ncbi:MAG: TrbC/VirB2 family protein [Clostridia bacterium]
MKKFIKVLPVVLMLILCLTTVFAAGTGIDTSLPAGGTAAEGVGATMGNVWSTITTVIQVLAFAAIILAGLRYMFASADSKADIKKQTVILIVGAIIVFLAEPLVGFIVTAAESII